MTKASRYPSFDVMREQDEWDDHTQAIVSSRLNMEPHLHFLTSEEAEMLKRICSLLIYDEREELLDYIVDHIDQTLHQAPGESERKAGVPSAPELVRSGLGAVEQGAGRTFGASFSELDARRQSDYLQSISESMAEPQQLWRQVPQKEFFQKLMTLTVEAYCSHPTIWSEIGYGGPAYPRGYVRTELGLLDPWEAQPE